MNHSFNVDVAIECGIEEAIILENIFYWTEKNRANNENFHDGRYWTYNSMEAFAELFPYMNRRKIRYAIDQLRDKGFIMTANFNKRSMDKTLWYALTNKSYELLKRNSEPITKYIPDGQNCPIDVTKLSNGNDNIVQAIPYITPNITIEKKDISSSLDSDISKETKKKRFSGINPSLEEIRAYIREKGYHFSAEEIVKYYTNDGELNVWRDKDEKLVRDWKKCCVTFENNWKRKYGSSYQPPKQNDKRIARAEEYERRKREEQDAAMAAFEAKMKEKNELSRIPF